MKLSERVALITGASSGIGAALAIGFAREGADIIVNYNTNEAGARKTQAAVEATGRSALVIQADVGESDEVDGLFDAIIGEHGRLDILVNNAGITRRKPFMELTRTDWDEVMTTNAKSVFMCSRRAVPLMRDSGAILNVSSIHAVQTTYSSSIYSATKGAIESLTRAMAIELGERGIRVNAIRPGWIMVERDTMDTTSAKYRLARERVPVRRAGEVGDLVPMSVLLCSPESGFTTGAIVTVDGGHLVGLNTPYPKGFDEEPVRTER